MSSHLTQDCAATASDASQASMPTSAILEPIFAIMRVGPCAVGVGSRKAVISISLLK